MAQGDVRVGEPQVALGQLTGPQSRLVRRRTAAMFADVVQEVLDAPAVVGPVAGEVVRAGCRPRGAL